MSCQSLELTSYVRRNRVGTAKGLPSEGSTTYTCPILMCTNWFMLEAKKSAKSCMEMCFKPRDNTSLYVKDTLDGCFRRMTGRKVPHTVSATIAPLRDSPPAKIEPIGKREYRAARCPKSTRIVSSGEALSSSRPDSHGSDEEQGSHAPHSKYSGSG
jgi:hypothetical protein